MGRIDRIVVQDFKSYKGRQIVGPFSPHFTAIIGPNGSGKSNLMDAISFVLGIRTQQLRGSLRELLYAGPGPGAAGDAGPAPDQERPRRGFVQLVYVTADGDEVTFSRVIQPAGGGGGGDAAYQSVYKIDDRTVTWDAYAQRLGEFGILVKARNFLVFQVTVMGQWGGAGEGLAGRGAHETFESPAAACAAWRGRAAWGRRACEGACEGAACAAAAVAAAAAAACTHAHEHPAIERPRHAGRHRKGRQPQPRGPDPAV
jgi:energy-coupling factor transporter ATP-binding protein EcfA2